MKAIRFVGNSDKLPAEYGAKLAAGSGWTIVNTLLGKANVTIRFEIDGDPLQVNVDKHTRDFLDLATMVYVVDEMEARVNGANHWNRHFEIFFPVDKPKVWSANEERLVRMLSTLSGDRYEFEWCQRPAIIGLGSHRRYVPRNFDGVCLFSGGMDSFLGAYKLLSEGKSLLLVGHQADGTAASAQTELAAFLRKRFPDKLRLIQCRAARSFAHGQRFLLSEKCEETHRPRSFLFLAVAIAMANASKIPVVYIPENGLIALNVPLGKSRLGTLSTRTAHPKYLTELEDFLENAEIYSGQIRNPFLFESKTDMVKSVDASLHGALRRSVSCARPSRYKDLKVQHCGYCVPCLYRRIAMAEAGIDSPSEYAFRLFEQLDACDRSKQIDFVSLVAFAQRITNASALERQMAVLSHGYFALDAGLRFGGRKVDNYDVWGNMLLRWSEDFLSKVMKLCSPKSRRILRL